MQHKNITIQKYGIVQLGIVQHGQGAAEKEWSTIKNATYQKYKLPELNMEVHMNSAL